MDWFTLRHEVTGVAEAQGMVEADFMAQPGVERVWRTHLANAGPYDHDGWATVVEFATLVPSSLDPTALVPAILAPTVFVSTVLAPAVLVSMALGAAAGTGSTGGSLRRRVSSRLASRLHPADRRRLRRAAHRLTAGHGLVVLAAGGPLLLVRAGGLALEAWTGLGPYVIAGVLYPLVALGTPAAAYAAAVGLDRRVDAGVAASVGLGAAALADLAIVGARTLPLEVVLQRSGLVAAVGLVAAGAARRATRERRLNDLVVGGVLLWVGVTVATLVGWT